MDLFRLLQYRVEYNVVNANISNFQFFVKEANVPSVVTQVTGGLVNQGVNIQFSNDKIFVDNMDASVTFGSGRRGSEGERMVYDRDTSS